jgi:predicted nucleic acid-binding protein
VLVAFIDADEKYHDWATNLLGSLQPPIFTCEAVITEAVYLLSKSRWEGAHELLAMIQRKALQIDFDTALHIDRIIELMQKYRDLPRDFADACLVIMTEQDRYSACEVLTIDSDFLAYRRHGRLRISVQMPS